MEREVIHASLFLWKKGGDSDEERTKDYQYQHPTESDE